MRSSLPPPHRSISMIGVTLWLGQYCNARTWLDYNRSKVNMITQENTGLSWAKADRVVIAYSNVLIQTFTASYSFSVNAAVVLCFASWFSSMNMITYIKGRARDRAPLSFLGNGYPHTHFLLSTHPSYRYPYSIIGDWLIKNAVSCNNTTAMGWDGVETFVWKDYLCSGSSK